MPQIKDYGAPETQGQNPLGGVSPDIRGAGSVGAGYETIGRAVTSVGEVLQKVEDQEQTSKAVAESSRAALLYQGRVRDMAREGKIDTEKLREEYQNHMADVRNSFTSRSAAEFFDRQTERVGGRIMGLAIKEKTAIASRTGKAEFTQTRNDNAMIVRNDPTQFEDVRQTIAEAVDAYVKSGALPAENREQAEQELTAELAINAIKGIAEGKQDMPPGMQGIDEADAAFKNGDYDMYLTPKQKDAVKRYLRTERAAQRTQELIAKRALEEARKAKIEVDEQEYLDDIYSNKFNVRKVLNNPDMKPEEKHKWIRRAKMEKENRTDENYVRKAYSDVMNGRKTMQDFVDDPRLTVKDLKGLAVWDSKYNAEAGQLKEARKQVLKVFDDAIMKGAGAMNPEGASRMRNMAVADLQAKEDEFRAAKKPVSSLYDPHSPDYFPSAKNMGKYRVTLADMLQQRANQTRTQPLNLPQRTAPIPGDENGPVGALPPPPEYKGPPKIRPGESLDDFDKRTGGK